MRAEIEIDVQNIYNDSFSSLVLSPWPREEKKGIIKGQSCEIERLALNGTLVQSARYGSDRSVVVVPLPSTLRPQERVAVSMSVVARTAAGNRWTHKSAEAIQFTDWLPRVVLGAGQPVTKRMTFPDHPADFEVSLTIDSGWFVVAPGELLNDKSLIGMMPNFDTVMVDVMHDPYIADGYAFSRLPSVQGRDTYVLRRRYNRGYDFLVLRGYLLDRGRRGDETVNAYYPQELASKWKYRLVDMGFGLNRSDQTGGLSASNESTKVVAVGKKSKWYSSGIRLIGAR